MTEAWLSLEVLSLSTIITNQCLDALLLTTLPLDALSVLEFCFCLDQSLFMWSNDDFNSKRSPLKILPVPDLDTKSSRMNRDVIKPRWFYILHYRVSVDPVDSKNAQATCISIHAQMCPF